MSRVTANRTFAVIVIFPIFVMDRIVSSQNPYVETVTLSVAIFGGEACKEVIKAN